MAAAQSVRPRSWLLGIGVVVAGAALFGSGMLVARALDDSPSSASPGTGDGAPTAPPSWGRSFPPGFGGANTNLSSQGDGTESKDDVARGGQGAPGMISPRYACFAPLGDVLSGSVIDLGRVGFVPSLLGNGFQLANVSVSSEAPCNEDGMPDGPGKPALHTQWIHTASGYQVSISQNQPAELPGNLIQGSWATFSRGGYGFSVSVWGAVGIRPADDLPARPAVVAPGVDPRAVEVLNIVLGQLAPDIPAGCYARMVEGSWGDLPALGIGDPRGAIPAGFSEDYVNVRTFQLADPSCGVQEPAFAGAGFDAQFTRRNGDQYLGSIWVSAYEMGPGEAGWPGYVDEYSANWSSGKFRFTVAAKVEGGTGTDVVRAIARAMDPRFDQACMIEPRTLSTADIAGLGFRVPAAPEGYRVGRESFLARELNGNCDDVPGFGTEYQLAWGFEGPDGAVIELGVSRVSGSEKGPAGGYRTDSYLNWTDGTGTYYFVSGWANGVSAATPPFETLAAVAKSVDPALDVDALQREDIGVPKPLPMPEPAARDAAGAGSAPTR